MVIIASIPLQHSIFHCITEDRKVSLAKEFLPFIKKKNYIAMLFSKYHKSELAESAGNELGLKQCFEKMIQMQIIIYNSTFPPFILFLADRFYKHHQFLVLSVFFSSFFFCFLIHLPTPPLFQQIIMHLIRSPCFLTMVTCRQLSF